MNRTFRVVITAALTVIGSTLLRGVDMTWTFAVQMSAVVSADPPRIELNWPRDPFPISSYTVQRKAPADRIWGEGVTLPGDATRFTDENVELGKAYEYQITKRAVAYTGFGYIAVGLHAPLIENRGRVVLLVDDVLVDPLAGEIARLQSDLVGDGWLVSRHNISRATSPADVKGVIKREYDADRERTKAVFLLGRIPIVRSGSLNVDGHGARAMPADVFYGEMDGEWTDANGDGVYDQSTLPSDVELQVGRVDFADLPGKYSPIPYPGEVELTKRYLDKNHAYRHAVVRPRLRALIGGLADGNGQAYSASGFRNFSALVGNSNLTVANGEVGDPASERWVSRLGAEDYLWAFGGGAGSDFTVGTLGLHGAFNDFWASDFLEYKAKATFYLMFGSWFVDWSKPDNVLRTALAAPEHGLAAAWAGRPHLFYHHMGIGETLGYGMRLSQNNDGFYQNQVQRQVRGVHIAQLGDPTLRMHAILPPTELRVGTEGATANLAWKPSTDAVLGYHVYRSLNAGGPYVRLTDQLVTEPRFSDASRPAESTFYLVRAVTLTSAASGSFFNASQGALANVASAPGLAARAGEPTGAATKPTDIVWFDDALPEGAEAAAERDRWNWVTENPAPFSGARSHQADNASGRHHHYFAWATSPLAVGASDTLFAYVYLDPANPPRQLMLTWLADNWEHRAYWGENLIDEGADGTVSRRRIGGLPPTGRWIRLELPASAVGVENQNITGMGFTLFDGRATWDRAGKSRP